MMSGWISQVCTVVAGPDFEDFFGLMADVYWGRTQQEFLIERYRQTVVAKAVEIGLITPGGDHFTHTPSGYLVGNVAKEHQHWIENGRKVSLPPSLQAACCGRDVLDLGCSYGRWLWEFQRFAKSVVGLELQREYICLGTAVAQREGLDVPEIRQGSAEMADRCFPSQSFDLVHSRLMMNHVHIGRTLEGIASLLRPRRDPVGGRGVVQDGAGQSHQQS